MSNKTFFYIKLISQKKIRIVFVLIFIFLSQGVDAKSKTVGDLLKNIEKKSKLRKKQKKSLPRFKKLSAKKQSKIDFGKIKPPSTNQLYYEEGTQEGELEKVTDQAIQQLYKLAQKQKRSPRRGEIWLRLAEQYVEKSRLIEIKIQKEFDRRVDLYNAGKIKNRPKINFAAAQNYNKKAVELYELFVRNFPKDKKIDQAYFFLGYNYFELQQVSKGESFYRKLSKEFPKSAYVDEANFSLGDYYFETEKWEKAKNYFRKVQKNKRHRLSSFAAYKAAWCNFKSGSYKQALKDLEKVIIDGRRSKAKDKNGNSNQIRLASEGIKDLVIFYAETGEPSSARAYFRRVTGRKTGDILYGRLGYYYADKGNRNAAKTIFSQLIEDNPTAAESFDYQYNIVKLYSVGGSGKTFQKELFRWIEDYGPGSPWREANRFKKDLIKKSSQLAEATLRNYTLQNHQTAQNSRAKFSQATAKRSYALYFSNFEAAKKSSEMRFFYSELLYDLKEYEEAAVNYMVVVNDFKTSPYFKQAMVNALLSIEKTLPTAEQVKGLTGESIEPVEFNSEVKKFEVIAKRYFEEVPQGKNIAQVKYRLAALHYYYNQFDEAIPQFNKIISEYPRTEYAEYSANLLLDIYNLKKDYTGLEKTANRILSVPDLKNSSVGKQISDIKLRTSFKKASDLESKGEFAGAALAYQNFAKENPDSNLSFQALYNSAVNYEKANEKIKAIAVYKRIVAVKKPPKKDLYKNSRKFLAVLLEQTGQYEEAVIQYEKFILDYPKDKLNLDFTFNAGVIRKSMRYYTASLKHFQKYISKSRKKDKYELLFYMGEIWEDRKKWSTAIKFYSQYVESPSQNKSQIIEASYRVANLYKKQRKEKEYDRWFKRVIAIQKALNKKKVGLGARYAAAARLHLVKKTYRELVSIRIPKNPSKQSKAVQRKLALLDKLKRDLKKVIEYDDRFSIPEALSLQGKGLIHLSNAIYDAPIPKGLSPDDVKVYKSEIDKLAAPLRDQAVQSFEFALERGFELQGYGKALLDAQNGLYKIKSKTNEVEKIAGEFHMVFSFDLPWRDKDLTKSDESYELKTAYEVKDEIKLKQIVQEKLARNSDDIDALLVLAAYYYQVNKRGFAMLALEKAEKIDSKDYRIANNIGVLFQYKNKNQEAILQFLNSKKLSKSKSGKYSLNLSSYQMRYGDYRNAKVNLEKFYRKQDLSRESSRENKIAVNYGLSLYENNDKSSATEVYREVLKKNSTDTKAIFNLANALVDESKDQDQIEKLINKLQLITENKGLLKKLGDLEKKMERRFQKEGET